MNRNEIAGSADYAKDCGVIEQLGGNSESPVHSALQRLSADIEEAHERFSVLEERLRFVCAPPETKAVEEPCPEPSPHSGLVCTLNQYAEHVEALIKRARSVRLSAFPPDVYSTLQDIAKQKKVSTAWVIRDAAEKYIAEQWPLFERKEH